MKPQVNELPEIMKRVEAGDGDAEMCLWDAFHQKLLSHVENRIRRRGVPTGMMDEEAITLSALESVFKCAKEGRLRDIDDWTELSRLVYAMTNRKFVDHWRRATKIRSQPGKLIEALSDNSDPASNDDQPFDPVAFDEELDHLLRVLPDDIHRQIAVMKLAGYSLEEIAERIGRSVPTVSRKWSIIRRMWADELER